MKFISDIRLLLLSIWLGSAVFFIGVAQSAFAVLAQQRELAGAIVNRNLAILDYGGIVIAAVLLVSSLIAGNANRFWLWIERFLLLMIAAACAVNEFVLTIWMSSLRGQMGKSIDEVALDDPLRIQFGQLHQWSTWTMMAAIIAALIAFFIIANRRFTVKETKSDVYDFSKEFKV